MKNKLILENKTNLPMLDFLELAKHVIKMGYVSNGQYCYLASFTIDGTEYHIVSEKNKLSDKLIFYKCG